MFRTGRPGPVLVDVPKDIQQQIAMPDWDAPMAITGYMNRLPSAPELSQMTAIVKALKGAKKPVVYLGGGTLDAAPQVREFIQHTGGWAGVGAGRGSWPLQTSAGVSGGRDADQFFAPCSRVICGLCYTPARDPADDEASKHAHRA